MLNYMVDSMIFLIHLCMNVYMNVQQERHRYRCRYRCQHEFMCVYMYMCVSNVSVDMQIRRYVCMCVCVSIHYTSNEYICLLCTTYASIAAKCKYLSDVRFYTAQFFVHLMIIMFVIVTIIIVVGITCCYLLPLLSTMHYSYSY